MNTLTYINKHIQQYIQQSTKLIFVYLLKNKPTNKQTNLKEKRETIYSNQRVNKEFKVSLIRVRIHPTR